MLFRAGSIYDPLAASLQLFEVIQEKKSHPDVEDIFQVMSVPRPCGQVSRDSGHTCAASLCTRPPTAGHTTWQSLVAIFPGIQQGHWEMHGHAI